MSKPHEVALIKLGGSLITDKTRPETARLEVIERLAGELAETVAASSMPLIVGHGSGSFGHVAASAAGIHRGVQDRSQLSGVGATQGQAFKLHRLVVTALREAGLPAFSVVPSSCIVAEAGQPERLWLEPLMAVLQLGMVPVVFGDVLMDRQWGASICSTESVFLALMPALGSQGVFVRRVVWLGGTDGVLDEDGKAIAEIGLSEIDGMLAELKGAAGTDVTGGIRHRLEAAGAMARHGVASWIGDGGRVGALRQGIEDSADHGTRILPAR
jgi:isopentenyl phosphate kinase